MKPHCQWAAWVFALLFVVGCANPADDVPKAQTGEAEPVVAADADAAEAEAGGESETAPVVEALPINAETTTVGFIGSKVTGTHEGGFKTVTGTFHLVPAQLEESRLEAEIDMDSTWTDSNKLTGHLKNADFFDVPKYPTAKFVSTKVAAISGDQAEGTHSVTGNLTLHGVTKSITFPATLTVTDEAASLESKFAINRKDFGINYSGSADNLIRDEVVIKLSINAPREADTEKAAASEQ